MNASATKTIAYKNILGFMLWVLYSGALFKERGEFCRLSFYAMKAQDTDCWGTKFVMIPTTLRKT